MKTQEIIKALRRMAVNTGTLNCLGVWIRAQLRCAWVQSAQRGGGQVEQLQAENDALFRAAMGSRKESGLMDE